MTPKIIEILKSNNNDICYLSPGLTRFLHRLDVSINKPFKQKLKEKYLSFCIENGVKNKKMKRIKMISIFCYT